MNILVYVLLLSIWTIVQNDGVNTTQKDETSIIKTNETKQHETMQTKMEGFRKRLLIIIISVIILGFVLVCFCCIYFNCVTEEPPKRKRVKKYARSPSDRSSKTSVTEKKKSSPNYKVNQYSDDKLSKVLSQEKAFASSKVETKIKILNQERARAKRLDEPSKQEIPCVVTRLEKGGRPSNSQRKSRQHHTGKSTHSRKTDSKVRSSYQSRLVKTPLPSTLETRYVRHTSSVSHNAHSQFISSTTRKIIRSSYRQRLHCTDETHEFFMRPSVKSCHCHKGICMVCRISEFMENSTFETKYRHRPFSRKIVFSRTFHKIESQKHVVYDNVNESDKMKVASENNDDSDKEVIIFCNVNYSDHTFKRFHVKDSM